MKAILVIDMPTNCNECTLLNYEYGCPIIGATGDRSKGRSVVCPLKPMPEHQKVKAGAGGYTRGFTAGYNKLRYLIVGADEEIEK